MDRLMALYNIASPSGREKPIIRFITAELKRMGISHTTDKMGNIYAVKGAGKEGQTYPCVVAHTDEVHHHKTGTYSAYMVNGSMIVGYSHKLKKMTGIGADDKNGIWICLKCLESFKVMKCAFFVQEETGCVGSGFADMGFFADCRFVIQCDRKGKRDIITDIHSTRLCSDEFLQKTTPGKYGYREERGMSTDVYTLKQRGLEISCVNLSCGYYQPHTDNEHTIVEDLYNCYRFVRHIIRCHKSVSTHKEKKRPVSHFRDNYGPDSGYGYGMERYLAFTREYNIMEERGEAGDGKDLRLY